MKPPAGSVEVKTIQPAGENPLHADRLRGRTRRPILLSFLWNGKNRSAPVFRFAKAGRAFRICRSRAGILPAAGNGRRRAADRRAPHPRHPSLPHGRAFLDSRKAVYPALRPDAHHRLRSRVLLHQRAARAGHARTGDTSPACYLDHIIATITHPSMSEMEKAKAVWLFTGTAVQHNAMLMNLRETCRRLTNFITIRLAIWMTSPPGCSSWATPVVVSSTALCRARCSSG